MSTDELHKMVATLKDVWSSLNDCWDSRKMMLTQLYDLKVCMPVTGKILWVVLLGGGGAFISEISPQLMSFHLS